MPPTDFELLTLLASGPHTLQGLVGGCYQRQEEAWYALLRLEVQGLVRCERPSTWRNERWELVYAPD